MTKLEGIKINETDFKWGMTFNEIIGVINSKNISQSQSAFEYFELECNKIENIDSLTCYIIAPSKNKPVNQLGFELKKLKANFFESAHTPYLKKIIELYGTPDKKEIIRLEDGQKFNKGYASSSVIFSANWWINNDILVSLSVFGGIRNRKEGEYGAGLYFQWLNEIDMAKPYYNEFITTEKKLIKNISSLTKTILTNKQRAFYRANYELQNPHIALENNEIRTAQLVLFANALYRTPKDISNLLKENEIGYFYSESMKIWCLCNKWDFTPLNNEKKLEYIDIKPARGSGYTMMRINSFEINDDEVESKILKNLTSTLEKKSKMKFTKSFGYDD